jgi:hypothetical protein
MPQKAFVYTELQISVPFADAPWRDIAKAIKKQPEFISKTWLLGFGNNSVGGLYSFNSIENARKYITGFFPEEARKIVVAHTTRVFDASVTEEASRFLNSPFYVSSEEVDEIEGRSRMRFNAHI